MRTEIADQTDFEREYNFFSVKYNYFWDDMITIFGVILNFFFKQRYTIISCVKKRKMLFKNAK